jgi:ABC-2 type transport system permease protein
MTIDNINYVEKTITPALDRQLSNKVSFGQVLRNSIIMAYRSLLKIRRTPEQLLDVTLQPILFTLMFTYLFGGAISGNVEAYLPIIIPGILVQSILTGSGTVGTMLREDMDKGVFDRFRALPISRISPLAGALVADTIRYAIVTILTFAMGYLIGYRPSTGFVGVLEASVFVVLFAWCTSWIFAFLGVIARTASTVQGISILVMFPLTFLSNAFVPVDTLPDWLKWFVNINPISHLISAIRELVNQGIIGQEFWLSVLGAIIIVAIFAPLTVQTYIRKV